MKSLSTEVSSAEVWSYGWVFLSPSVPFFCPAVAEFVEVFFIRHTVSLLFTLLVRYSRCCKGGTIRPPKEPLCLVAFVRVSRSLRC